MILTGYPIVFTSKSVDLGGFIEVVRPSAVDRTLRTNADVAALANHNADRVLGRISAGTLKLKKDARGLNASIDIDTSITYAADVARVVERGDAVGGSFGFHVVDDIWSIDGGTPFRELLDVDIREVSVGVVFPAYPGTQLSAHRHGLPTQPRGLSVTLAEKQLAMLRLRWEKSKCFEEVLL